MSRAQGNALPAHREGMALMWAENGNHQGVKGRRKMQEREGEQQRAGRMSTAAHFRLQLQSRPRCSAAHMEPPATPTGFMLRPYKLHLSANSVMNVPYKAPSGPTTLFPPALHHLCSQLPWGSWICDYPLQHPINLGLPFTRVGREIFV